MYMCMCVHVYVCVSECVCVYVCMYVCMHVCMYVYTYMYIYTRQAKVVQEVRLARLEQQIKSRMFAQFWQEWRKMTRYKSVFVCHSAVVPAHLTYGCAGALVLLFCVDQRTCTHERPRMF